MNHISDTVVTGHSDDVIDLSGGIYDEIQHYSSEAARLVFDNGVVLDMVYAADGIWRITVVAGHDQVTHTPCPDPAGGAVYTDTAVVIGARSVTCGDQHATAR